MHRKYTFIIITKNILEPTFDPYPRSISTDNYRTSEEQRERVVKNLPRIDQLRIASFFYQILNASSLLSNLRLKVFGSLERNKKKKHNSITLTQKKTKNNKIQKKKFIKLTRLPRSASGVRTNNKKVLCDDLISPPYFLTG